MEVTMQEGFTLYLRNRDSMAYRALICSLLVLLPCLGCLSQSKQVSIRAIGSSPGEQRTFDGIEFVWIPPGTFEMGAPEAELDWAVEQIASESEGKDEARSDLEAEFRAQLHTVRITKGFWMGKYEVTQKEYKRVIGVNPSYYERRNQPVEGVSWEDATEFCRRLSAKSGANYRLPTEAEWEYACRAGTRTTFYWGNSSEEAVMKDYCWYDKNAREGNWSYPHAPEDGPQPVGLKKPNAWGLHDMLGNVWEWCSDWDSSEYYSKSPLEDPPGPSSGSLRILRGGAWYYYAVFCRSAHRNGRPPDDYSGNYGFRVVRSGE